MDKNKFVKKLMCIILSLILLIALSTESFCIFEYSMFPARDGAGEVNITIAGDSYAGYFSQYEKGKDYNFLVFANAGFNTEHNYSIMMESIDAISTIIFIAVGVNDQRDNIPPSEFKHRMTMLALKAKEAGKIIFFHTYMIYDYSVYSMLAPRLYNIAEYDAALRSVANNYSNVYYVDMSEFNQRNFWQSDGLHYNKVFYDELYRRMKLIIDGFYIK